MITSTKPPLIHREPHDQHRRSRTATLLSRRSLRYALGLLWILDGALQLQSFMFTKGFAHMVIAPAAAGQPSFVAGPVHWNADLIAHQPALFNAAFAGIQLALGVGLLLPRYCRPALVGSMLWSAGVWYLGEGLGGVASGHVTALMGAPGAAALYIVVALAAWPAGGGYRDGRSGSNPVAPPFWVGRVWALLWIGFALLNLLPANSAGSTVGGELAGNASSVPTWLGHLDHWLANGAQDLGRGTGVLLVGAELAIGLLVLVGGRFRSPATWAGIALTGLYWAAGQSFGQLFSGQATDPSTGPLLMLIGLAALGAAPRNAKRAAGLAPPIDAGAEAAPFSSGSAPAV